MADPKPLAPVIALVVWTHLIGVRVARSLATVTWNEIEARFTPSALVNVALVALAVAAL